jgi:hypothetical protein
MAASLVEPGSAAKNAPASSHGARCARVFLGGGSPDPPGESKVRRMRRFCSWPGRLDGTRGVTQCGVTYRLSTISIER